MIRADWTPTLEDFRAFAALSGDVNPIHTDPAYAARHPFGRPVAHGMLIHARLRALAAAAGVGMPGQVALMFPNPAYADAPLVLVVAETAGQITATAARADGTMVCVAEWSA